jgi:hypothetical protein
MPYVINNQGHCVVCDSHVTFFSENDWLRDHYLCNNCSSIPRERALMYCIEKFYPNWRELNIHESSPANRGASLKLKNNCKITSVRIIFQILPSEKRIQLGGGMKIWKIRLS